MPKEPEPRVDVNLPIRVFGMDAEGRPFSQKAHAQNISQHGARLAGLEKQLKPGDVIGVQFGDQKTRCKVIWVVDAGPVQKIEAWRAHANGSRTDCEAAIRSSLTSVSLPADEEFLRRRPSQLSVGQAQRVLIAMTIMHHPALLIADEATSALDVITQSEILALFAKLNRETGMAILYISHDLPSVAGICHRIAILHEGQIVECGATERIFADPQHPYTGRLIAALPARLGLKVPRVSVATSGL